MVSQRPSLAFVCIALIGGRNVRGFLPRSALRTADPSSSSPPSPATAPSLLFLADRSDPVPGQSRSTPRKNAGTADESRNRRQTAAHATGTANAKAVRSKHQQQHQQQGRRYKNSNSKHSSRNNNNSKHSSRNNNNSKHSNNKHSNNGNFGSDYAFQLNKRIARQENALDLLEVLAGIKGALTTYAGGGTLNTVNYSTALHRIARHVAYARVNRDTRSQRTGILADPRFGLLVCSLAEAFAAQQTLYDLDGAPLQFQAREISNIAWAVAKIRIAPPVSALPLQSEDDAYTHLRQRAADVRAMIYQVAKHRSSSRNRNDLDPKPWIPTLSQLCGSLIDAFSHKVRNDSQHLAFKNQEWSNYLWALATIGRATREDFQHVIPYMLDESNPNRGHAKPQEWSNTVWAMATAGIRGPEIHMYPFIADKMDNGIFLEQFKPQELANTAWGVATTLSSYESVNDIDTQTASAAFRILRTIARESIRRNGSGFKSQEISNTLWAFATLGLGITSYDDSSDYMILASDDPQGDEQLVKQATAVFIEYAKTILPKFKSQELNNLAWALARLEVKDTVMLQGIAKQLCDTSRPIQPQDIGTTLWAFAKLEYSDYDAFVGCTSRFLGMPGHVFKSQELSNTCWAIATAEICPRINDVFDTTLLPKHARPDPRQLNSNPLAHVFAKASAELMSRPDSFKPQEIKDILWSFSRVDLRHPQLFRFVAQYLVDNPDRLFQFLPQGIGNMVWAFAKQAQMSVDVIARHPNDVRLSCSSGRLSVYTTVLLDIGEVLLHRLFDLIAKVSLTKHNRMNDLNSQDLANTVWAYAVLGLNHAELMDAAKTQLLDRLLKMGVTPARLPKGQEIANLLWALAYLNCDCARDVISKLADTMVSSVMIDGKMTVESIARFYNRQELANIAWACAVFGEYPPQLIQMIFMGLFGVGQDTDPEFLHRVHGSGTPTSVVIIGLYLQVAMDLDDAAVPGMQLPDNFPEGWEANSSDDAGSERSSSSTLSNSWNLMENGLLLSISRTQREVASTFQRLGVQLVDEHCITMRDLASAGARVTPFDKELLSIDLADPDRRIGIEVDGPAHFVSNVRTDDFKGTQFKMTQNGRLDSKFYWGDGQEINGPTTLKMRLLDRLGWTIYSVPFWEWSDMEGDEAAKEEYCKKLLGDIP